MYTCNKKYKKQQINNFLDSFWTEVEVLTMKYLERKYYLVYICSRQKETVKGNEIVPFFFSQNRRKGNNARY